MRLVVVASFVAPREFLPVDSMLELPVPRPCVTDFLVELEREARVGPVAGAVEMVLPALRLAMAVWGVPVPLRAEPLGLLVRWVPATVEDWAIAAEVEKASAATRSKIFIVVRVGG